MNQYKELKEKQSKDIDVFPFIFAFTTERLNEQLKEKGLDINNVKLCYIGNGIYMMEDDIPKYSEMVKKHNMQIEERIKQDLTGEGFIKDMFKTELKNYEYGYTLEVDDAIERLGYTIDEINKNPILKNGLELAKKEILKEEEELEM